MDASYKLKNFFLKTAKTLNQLKQKEIKKSEKKLQIINEIEEELFYMRESAKKLLREEKITQRIYEKLKNRLKQIEQEIKKIKSDLTNL
ncbi:MAG: hypothetical protein ACLFN8_00310 [Candidatus Woesearchaeota archaeon]